MEEEHFLEVDPEFNIYSFGGEDHYEKLFAEYGIDFGVVSVDNISPEQASSFAVSFVNHLMTNGHRFKIYNEAGVGEQIKLIKK